MQGRIRIFALFAGLLTAGRLGSDEDPQDAAGALEDTAAASDEAADAAEASGEAGTEASEAGAEVAQEAAGDVPAEPEPVVVTVPIAWDGNVPTEACAPAGPNTCFGVQVT